MTLGIHMKPAIAMQPIFNLSRALFFVQAWTARGLTSACAVLALYLTPAHAGMGWTELKGLQGDGPVTVFYPTAATDQSVQRGPFSIAMAP